MKQNIYNRILELAIKKYQKYNIDIRILEELLTSLNNKEYDEEIQIILDFNLLIEKYIIEEIKNQNIDYQIILITEQKNLKSIIRKNKKYNCAFNVDKIYEDAIEEMIYNYDSSKPISKNILIQSEKVIENYKNKPEEEIAKVNNENKEKLVIEENKTISKNESIKNNVKLNNVSKNELTNDELVSLLIKYKESLNLSEKELSDLLKISQGNINYCITKKRNISKESIEKILKHFLVTTTKELEEKINSEIEKYNEENISNDELVSLLIKYKESLNLSEKELSDLLKISQGNINYCMTKKRNISKASIEKILKYFSVTTTKELEEKINSEIEKYNEEIRNEIINDKLLLKEETSNAKMSSEEKIEDNELFVDKRINDELPLKQEISNIRPKEKSNVQIIEKNDLLKLVNIDILYSLLDESLKNNTISKEEYIISWFLFGRNEGIFYSKEKISEFLNVNIEYIYDVYITSLKKYRNYFNDLLEKTAKLELKNTDLN